MRINWLNIADYSQDIDLAEVHISEALYNGQLALLLGAGVSADFGLPKWWKLIHNLIIGLDSLDTRLEKIAATLSENRSFDDLKLAASLAKEKCASEADFIGRVKSALYKDHSDRGRYSPSALQFAIGALIMGSRRGNVRDVWTLNYDDLIEWYLSINGFVAQTISEVPCLIGGADVNVFHPHGFLPLDPNLTSSLSIVLDKTSYAERALGKDQPWRDAFQAAITSKVFLCVGLSWTDKLVNDILLNAAKANKGRPSAFWCFHEKQPSSIIEDCHLARVAALQFDGHREYPEFILKVCRRAATMI